MNSAFSTAIPHSSLAAIAQLSENSRLGFRSKNTTLHQGIEWSKSTLALGLLEWSGKTASGHAVALLSGVKTPSWVVELFGKALGAFLGKGAEEGTELAAKELVVDVDSLSNKIMRQMTTRGWTKQQILDTVETGNAFRTINKATGGPATEYVSTSGRFVVVDDTTKQVIQVSGPGFLPNHPAQ